MKKSYVCIFQKAQISSVLLDFSLSVKAAPHECVIRTGLLQA